MIHQILDWINFLRQPIHSALFKLLPPYLTAPPLANSVPKPSTARCRCQNITLANTKMAENCTAGHSLRVYRRLLSNLTWQRLSVSLVHVKSRSYHTIQKYNEERMQIGRAVGCCPRIG
jgi:hypothetical protein